MYYVCITYVLRVILKIDISFLYRINGLVFAMDLTVFCEGKTSGIGTALFRVLLLAPCQYHSTNTP
jgi:hypothetical protein